MGGVFLLASSLVCSRLFVDKEKRVPVPYYCVLVKFAAVIAVMYSIDVYSICQKLEFHLKLISQSTNE